MILQSLTAYYETLERKGEITSPGWCNAKVSFALEPVSYTHRGNEG